MCHWYCCAFRTERTARLGCPGPGCAAIWTAWFSSRAHKVKMHKKHRKRIRQSVVLWMHEKQRGKGKVNAAQTAKRGPWAFRFPANLFLTQTSSQCQLGCAQPHQEPVWGTLVKTWLPSLQSETHRFVFSVLLICPFRFFLLDTVCVAFYKACWVKYTMQMCTVLHALLSLCF